jgi:AraC-like DNA-binding protein
MRQREPSVRGMAVTYPAGTAMVPTPASWDHLIFASSGVMSIETDRGTWVVPPHRALWAPAGEPYEITLNSRVALRSLYFRTELHALGTQWRAVNVTPLLRELILHAVRTAPLDLTDPSHERLVGVLVDQFATLAQAPLQLPMPGDPRAVAFAGELRSSAGDVSTADVARAVGASRRTLERLFALEVGMTIGQWRQRLALLRGLQLLAAGQTVTQVAVAVGYSTPSAFGAMFRSHLGESPGRYFRAK